MSKFGVFQTLRVLDDTAKGLVLVLAVIVAIFLVGLGVGLGLAFG